MRPIKINITRTHIKDGVRGSACDCPIALALKDSLITNNVTVNMSGIWVNGTRYDVDKKDLRFMNRFDNGERVNAYSFSLDRTSR